MNATVDPKPISPHSAVAAGARPQVARRRIEGWKAVAAHLGRSVRTVQRWEKTEGLPVRRLAHEKMGAVWAYDTDLDTWWRDRSDRLSSEFDLQGATGIRPRWLFAAIAIAVLLLAAAVMFLAR